MPPLILGGVFVISFAFFGIGYFYLSIPWQQDVRVVDDEVVSNVASTAVAEVPQWDKEFTAADTWQSIYPDTKLMHIGDVTVHASIADSWPERIQGLSGTPYLPENVVKLFVFDSPGFHAIWMKDMAYAIDIFWVNDEGVIVDIAANVSPLTYPESFVPASPARYVIEATAGFVQTHAVTIGEKIVLPVETL